MTAVPEDKINETKVLFNKYNKHIQFTIEEEVNQRISFLDVTCIRDNRAIKTDWFHKSTWSGRYLNFKSHLPMTYKKNTIALLAEKILLLSEPEFHSKNFELLRSTLLKNQYPKKLIEKTIEKVKVKMLTKAVKPTSEIKPIVAIPYVKGLFEKLKNCCKDDLTIVGKAENNLRKSIFTRLKDPTPLLQQSNLVYELKCECDASYRGQTKQRLGNRVNQHMNHTNSKNVDHSALCKHAILHNHKPKWNDVKIICRETNGKKRDVLEMIAIKRATNCVNKQTDSILLSNAYQNLI